MYVCICKAVTETQIENAIDKGAHNLRDLQKQLGVATQCGQCACCAREMLARRQDTQPASQPLRWLPVARTV